MRTYLSNTSAPLNHLAHKNKEKQAECATLSPNPRNADGREYRHCVVGCLVVVREFYVLVLGISSPFSLLQPFRTLNIFFVCFFLPPSQPLSD